MMKLRFASPAHLIDVNRLPGLDGIEERDGTLRIGRSSATTIWRHRT
jgi:carbon-monoxide dehydrogenase medium subunit